MLLVTPLTLLAEETSTSKQTEVTVTYDPRTMCIFESNVYSLGIIIKAGGKEQKCIYVNRPDLSANPVAMWARYSEVAKEFLP